MSNPSVIFLVISAILAGTLQCRESTLMFTKINANRNHFLVKPLQVAVNQK